MEEKKVNPEEDSLMLLEESIPRIGQSIEDARKGEESYDVFFQFGEGEPVKFATTYDGNHFSLTLNANKHECPEVNFTDGNGNHFKLYMQKCT